MKKLSELIKENKAKKYDILFADLDGTLIETKSGATFPKDASDYKYKDDVINSIIKLAPTYLFIVTNQGGIGKFITKADFEHKLSNIVDYLELVTGVKIVDAVYCDSNDKSNEFRKPNTGMLRKIIERLGIFAFSTKQDMLMIGDASGLAGQFSDSDKKAAENFGIDYMDVDEFVKTY